MSDINLQLVREFFELNRFRVHTRWWQSGWQSSRGDHGLQLYVDNPFFRGGGLSEPVLTALDLPRVERAVVELQLKGRPGGRCSLCPSSGGA